MSIKNWVSDLGYNLPGWKSKRRILVLESDDWGTIRMASARAYGYFEKKGVAVSGCAFNRYDALETNADVVGLIEVLSGVKDKNNRPAIMTLNNVVANPDFSRIRDASYGTYKWERFDTTLSRYPDSSRVMGLYQEGIAHRVFKPQFHGREHVNITTWMNDLKNDEPIAQMAFEWDMFSLPRVGDRDRKMEYMDAMAYYQLANKPVVVSAILEGMELFQQIWGYVSTTVIAPCYVWNPETEQVWDDAGIRYIQSGKSQMIPVIGTASRKPVRHYTGQTNALKQKYTVRNVTFEPSVLPQHDWVDSALRSVATAFAFGKPAIVNTHRVNYIGRIDPANRDRGLKLLDSFLHQITQKWPDVEFMSSDELGHLMSQNIN